MTLLNTWLRFWLCTLRQVNFNHVNKIEARYKLLRLNVKLSDILLLRTCDLSYIASVLFAKVNFTHVRMEKLHDSGNQP